MIAGEAGDNIGRGGRKSMYFKDESAHYARPELIEAALGDNTNVQIDISSVNGVGNVFHRRRESGLDWYPGADLPLGPTRIFVIDWSDHPARLRSGTTSARLNLLLKVWVISSHRKLTGIIAAQSAILSFSLNGLMLQLMYTSTYLILHQFYRLMFGVPGLDIADDGEDRNALTIRQWIIVRSIEDWGERDAGVTTRRTHAAVRDKLPIKVQYDCIGPGAASEGRSTE